MNDMNGESWWARGVRPECAFGNQIEIHLKFTRCTHSMDG